MSNWLDCTTNRSRETAVFLRKDDLRVLRTTGLINHRELNGTKEEHEYFPYWQIRNTPTTDSNMNVDSTEITYWSSLLSSRTKGPSITSTEKLLMFVFFCFVFFCSHKYIHTISSQGRVVLVNPATTFATQPSCIYILHQKRAWSVLWVTKPFMDGAHDGETCVQTN